MGYSKAEYFSEYFDAKISNFVQLVYKLLVFKDQMSGVVEDQHFAGYPCTIPHHLPKL